MQKVAIGILIAILIASYWSYDVYQRQLRIQAEQTLLVQPGAHLSSLAEELQNSGWLPWPRAMFVAYGRFTAGAGHIQAGEYLINEGTTVPMLLATLRRGDVIQRAVTFPEGWTVNQWVNHLGGLELLSGNTVAEIEAELGVLAELEGRFFPDTYSYTRGETASSVLRRAMQQMDQVLVDVWPQRDPNTPLKSQGELLILASMIEKETGFEGDRGLIASVFVNRLNKNMRLQSDPTVIYGLKEFDGDLKRRHLRQPHPFNTYVIPGLPAGPICNPGRSSLLAASQPEASPYFYFVAKGNGHSQFSVTLAEHNQAVMQYQKAGRVKNYSSVPVSPGDGSQ